MSKEYTCDLVCSPYFSDNDYSSWRITESSILRAFVKMYSDGILTLRPKDVNIKNSHDEIPSDKDEIAGFQVIFYEE